MGYIVKFLPCFLCVVHIFEMVNSAKRPKIIFPLANWGEIGYSCPWMVAFPAFRFCPYAALPLEYKEYVEVYHYEQS